jgi:hypothetical protein
MLIISGEQLSCFLSSSGLLGGFRWFGTDILGPIVNPETSVSNHLTPRNNHKTEEFGSAAAKA